MLLYIVLAVVVVIIVGLLVFVAMQPAAFRITRSLTIPLPAAPLFALVNDFHRWAEWSPFEKLDPAMKKTFTGSPAGAGAVYAWSGNNKAGEGQTTILESKPNELVRMKLVFTGPFKATNIADFTFVPNGDQTVVTWLMTGNNNFMGKAFALMVNMDKMVGKEFEEGLRNMQKAAAK